MMAARHQHHITIGHRHGFVDLAVIGIHPLNAKAAGGVKAVIIGFFQIGDARVIILVMAVAGIR